MAPSDPRQTKFVLDESRIPRAWYNIAADLPGRRPPRRSTRAPASRSGRTTWRRCSRWRSSARRSRPSARSRSPSRSAMPTGSTARARSTAPTGSSARSIRRPTSTTSTRAAARPAATSRTPRSPRRSTTRSRASPGSRPRPAPGSGGVRWPSPGAYFGLEVKVYMVRASYDQKPYRRILMETYGAEVVASPSPTTNYGRSGAGRRRPTARARSGSPSARRSRTPRPARTRSTPSGRCSTTSCSTRRSSARRRIEQMGMAGE